MEFLTTKLRRDGARADFKITLPPWGRACGEQGVGKCGMKGRPQRVFTDPVAYWPWRYPETQQHQRGLFSPLWVLWASICSVSTQCLHKAVLNSGYNSDK